MSTRKEIFINIFQNKLSLKYTSLNGGIDTKFRFMTMLRNVIQLKYVVDILFILVLILHSIAANNKELSSEYLNTPAYLHDNRIFVEQNQTFGIVCNSSKRIKACSISSPYNAFFLSIMSLIKVGTKVVESLYQSKTHIAVSLQLIWLMLVIQESGNVFYQ